MTLEHRIFEEFPGISKSQWEELILKDLKGADYEKKLVWPPIEGFKVNPYYREEDIQNLDHLQHAASNQIFVKKDGNDWYINQYICESVSKDANKKALDCLQKGANSLSFHIDDNSINSYAEFETLLQDILLDAIEVHFKGSQPARYMEWLIAYAQNKNLNKSHIRGSIQYNPFSSFTCEGLDADDTFTEEISMLSDLIRKASSNFPHLRVIEVNGAIFQNAGSTLVQELAYSLAMASEYIHLLSENGLTPKEILPHIQFNLATGSNYFPEIAKIRALRYLWLQLCKAYGVSEEVTGELFIHSETAKWNMTIYDAHVNLLRATTEAMSAILGGCNSLTVHPFNMAYTTPDDLSDRLARNLQSILKDEAYLDKVGDVAGGSYYIEQLTAQMIDRSWKLFLETEEAGGYIQAFRKGLIQDKIEQTAKTRDTNYATRKETILGVNQFPNITEVKPEVSIPNLSKNKTDGSVRALLSYRSSQAFEEMRHLTDIQTQRPNAFLLTYGNLAMRRARAQFAQNFFGCAGFSVTDNNGFANAEEGIKMAQAQGSRVIVLCSSDDEYEALAAEALKHMNGEILVVAGNPANKEPLEKLGINHFIHVRSNVLETLLQFQKLLGII